MHLLGRVCVLKGLKVLSKNKLADVCCTLSRRDLHAVAVTMAFIGFSLMCFNNVTNILSAIFVVVVVYPPPPPLPWVAFALTSFILATLQSCSVAVALWCVCVRQKKTAQSVFNVYKCHSVWYLSKTRVVLIYYNKDSVSPKLPPVVWCSLLLYVPVCGEWEALEKATPFKTFETSQCCCFSGLYDASTCWCDHSGALYC